MDKPNNTLEVQAHNQCYRNRTETGKTSQSDRFTGLAGPVSKKNNKTEFFSKPGIEPAGLDWGLMKLNLKKKQKIELC